eukprot:TRINITY_DN2603_c0_g1_i1.p1 TRINITY_DN2603_c0_g1~~TRINITY_DN2603_c0_g1_i1.p1  ORF type:complete len:180 (-),score=48.77 TRINITY_DN2603_c0_g1_i1:147-686(-)
MLHGMLDESLTRRAYSMASAAFSLGTSVASMTSPKSRTGDSRRSPEWQEPRAESLALETWQKLDSVTLGSGSDAASDAASDCSSDSWLRVDLSAERCLLIDEGEPGEALQRSKRQNDWQSDEIEQLRQQARDALLQGAESGKLQEILQQSCRHQKERPFDEIARDLAAELPASEGEAIR